MVLGAAYGRGWPIQGFLSESTTRIYRKIVAKFFIASDNAPTSG
jgi:hypothetical protein